MWRNFHNSPFAIGLPRRFPVILPAMLPSYFHEISLSPLLSVEAEAASSERVQALAVLKSRERSVVIRRFGLDGHQPMTLELIGAATLSLPPARCAAVTARGHWRAARGEKPVTCRLTAGLSWGKLNPMFSYRRLRLAGHAAAAVAMFLMAGGHWGALQTVAWAGMLRTYSQEDGSLLSGMKKTFDGDHPCTMCTSIKTGQESERTSPAVIASLKKLEAFPAPLRAMLPLRDCAEFVFPDAADVRPVARADAPPVPVPIADLV